MIFIIQRQFRVISQGYLSQYQNLSSQPMNRKFKLIDFSNIYSPQNKSIRGHIFNSKSPKPTKRTKGSPTPLANNTPRSNHFTTSSVSPKNILKISVIPQIDQIRKTSKLAPSQDKIADINYSLDIEEQSRKGYQLRMQAQNHYLCYDRNPLLQLPKPTDKPATTDKAKNKDKSVTMIQAITSLDNTDFYKKLQLRAQKTESSVQSYIKSKKQSQRFKQVEQAAIIKEQQPRFNATNLLMDVIKSPFQDLEDIADIKEQSFFINKRNKEPFNLFELKFNPNSPMFRSGRQQLTLVNFSFESMSAQCQSSENQKCLRALSTYSRLSVLNTYSKAIPQDFTINQKNFPNIELEHINIQDIMLLASGQLSPEALTQLLNADQEFVRKALEEENLSKNYKKQIKITYGEHQLSTSMNYCIENVDKTERAYLLQERQSLSQKKQVQLSSEYLAKMKKMLQKQMQCLDNAIKDIKLHGQMRKDQDKILLEQLDADIDTTSRETDVEKKIRRNKVRKNQTEKIKIQYATKNCNYKKKTQQMFSTQRRIKNKQQSKQQSQSKSKSRPRSKQNIKSVNQNYTLN